MSIRASRPIRGVAHVTKRCGGMRWTRLTARDERLSSRTAKSCGPGAPTLAFKPLRGELLGGDGGKRARSPAGHRGEHEVSRKPSRRESRRCSGSPVVLPPCFFVARGPWVQSAPGFPCALCIVRATKFMQGSGTSCREDAGVCLRCCLICESGLSTRRCERSEAIHFAAC
jgi:hypothetical protein